MPKTSPPLKFEFNFEPMQRSFTISYLTERLKEAEQRMNILELEIAEANRIRDMRLKEYRDIKNTMFGLKSGLQAIGFDPDSIVVEEMEDDDDRDSLQ